MKQIDFILSELERINFIKYCFEHGCHVVPDLRYDSDEYIVATDINLYYEYCKKSPLLFITSKKFSVYPLELDYFEDGNKKRYFINQRHGGPTIDFYSPIIGEIEDNTVGPGYIGIFPFYYRNREKFVPNKGLIDLYKFFTVYLKKTCQNVKLAHRTFWVGNKTIERAKNGEIHLLPISNQDILTLL